MVEKELHQRVVAKDIATGEALTEPRDDDFNAAPMKMAAAEIRELPMVSHGGSQKVISMRSRKDAI